ncbi:Hsp33 family molecular chaperone HslO [Pendulispora rubella]|uniref:Hsp33 family molecular chaperone HslO n=1 Tax=Pendulispora rubella TaxID=2741070 RepID=A0ABZ2LA65_9BACT
MTDPDPKTHTDSNQAGGDRVLRAITDDGAFRVITVESSRTVRAAIEAQRPQGDLALLFADLITGSILVRETMSPDQRVQIILQAADQTSRMVADSNPDMSPWTRGLVQLAPKASSFDLGAEARLQVARRLYNGSLHQGVVAVPASGGISGALMSYMQTSEQVVSMIAVGTYGEGDSMCAGGYIVQLLPDVGEGPLMLMTERLKDFVSMTPLLEKKMAEPRALLSELLYGMPYTEVGESGHGFGCNCSEERILFGLSTLPRTDVQHLIEQGEVLEIACDYCRRQYKIAPAKLRGLLEQN